MILQHSRYYTYIKPLLENKLVRSYSSYVFSIITVTIMVVFAIRPTVSTILNLQKDVENHQQALQKLKQKAQNLTQAKNNLAALDQATKGKLATAVPEQAEVTALVKALQSALPQSASASAIQIQPVILSNTSEKKMHPDKGQVNFTLNLEGSYQLFIEVLNNLYRSARIISLDNITVGKQVEGPAILSVNGTAYYLKWFFKADEQTDLNYCYRHVGNCFGLGYSGHPTLPLPD